MFRLQLKTQEEVSQNVVQRSRTNEENHKFTQSDEQKLNSVNEFIGLTEAEINSSSLQDLDCIVVQLSKGGTNSQSVQALPDTGANVNVLPGEIAKLLGPVSYTHLTLPTNREV